MKLRMAIKKAIKWGLDQKKKNAFEANLYAILGVNNPVNIRAAKERKEIDEILEAFRKFLDGEIDV